MKRTKLILILLMGIAQSSYAQINWAEYSQSFPDGAMDKPSTVAVISAIRSENDSFWINNPNDRLYESLTADSAFQHLRPKKFAAITTYDTASVHFFLHGVNQLNAKQFQFRATTSTRKSFKRLPRGLFINGSKNCRTSSWQIW